jgi:hypothetical protein
VRDESHETHQVRRPRSAHERRRGRVGGRMRPLSERRRRRRCLLLARRRWRWRLGRRRPRGRRGVQRRCWRPSISSFAVDLEIGKSNNKRVHWNYWNKKDFYFSNITWIVNEQLYLFLVRETAFLRDSEALKSNEFVQSSGDRRRTMDIKTTEFTLSAIFVANLNTIFLYHRAVHFHG